MKTVDERVLAKRAYALRQYRKAYKNAPEEAIKDHICCTLQARLCKELPKSNIYVYGNSVSIYLYGDDNVGKDVELAFEKHNDLIRLMYGDFKEHSWNGDSVMNYKHEKGSIDVNVAGSTTCKRVKIGTKSRTIKEDIYDIVCD